MVASSSDDIWLAGASMDEEDSRKIMGSREAQERSGVEDRDFASL
jgi:hypothetical protein